MSNNPFALEGEWNNFYIKLIEPSEHSRVVDFMILNYVFDEPVNKWLSTSDPSSLPEEFLPDYTKYYLNILDEELSYMAIDQRSNQIAGVRLSRNHTAEPQICTIEYESRQFRAFYAVKKYLEVKADIFNKFPITHYVDLSGTAVQTSYRRNGLLRQMQRRALSYYKHLNFSLAKTVYINPIALSAGRSFGFSELSRVYFTELHDSEDMPYFPNFSHPDWYAALMVLKI